MSEDVQGKLVQLQGATEANLRLNEAIDRLRASVVACTQRRVGEMRREMALVKQDVAGMAAAFTTHLISVQRPLLIFPPPFPPTPDVRRIILPCVFSHVCVCVCVWVGVSTDSGDTDRADRCHRFRP